ncbi:hypothetical protein HDZ31DRAFT_27946 [Schizophyllum fasciatum]
MGKSTGSPSQGGASSKKAAALTGYYRHRSPPPGLNYWPCKLDGCKKQFQREADLRRHQRTSKTHSKAMHMCPQCEATFTRPDACRRHQRSKHGTVSEPLIALVGAGANEEDDPSPEGSPDVDGDGMSGDEEVRDEPVAEVLSDGDGDGDDESDSAMSEDAPLSEEEPAPAVVAVAPEASYVSHDTVYGRTADDETYGAIPASPSHASSRWYSSNPLDSFALGESKPVYYPSPYYRITAPSWHCGPFSIDRYICHPTSNARNSPDESSASDEEEHEDEKDAPHSDIAFVRPAVDAHYYSPITLTSRPKAAASS